MCLPRLPRLLPQSGPAGPPALSSWEVLWPQGLTAMGLLQPQPHTLVHTGASELRSARRPPVSNCSSPHRGRPSRPAFPSWRDPRVRSDSRCKGCDEPSSPTGLPALRMGPQPGSPSELLAFLSCFRQSWPVPPTLCCPESPRALVPLHPPGSTPRKYFSPTTK